MTVGVLELLYLVWVGDKRYLSGLDRELVLPLRPYKTVWAFGRLEVIEMMEQGLVLFSGHVTIL